MGIPRIHEPDQIFDNGLWLLCQFSHSLWNLELDHFTHFLCLLQTRSQGTRNSDIRVAVPRISATICGLCCTLLYNNHHNLSGSDKTSTNQMNRKLITLGYTAFVPKFDKITFVTSYIGIAVYLLNIVIWKIWRRTKRVKSRTMDLSTDRERLEKEAAQSLSKSVFKNPGLLSRLRSSLSNF